MLSCSVIFTYKLTSVWHHWRNVSCIIVWGKKNGRGEERMNEAGRKCVGCQLDGLPIRHWVCAGSVSDRSLRVVLEGVESYRTSSHIFRTITRCKLAQGACSWSQNIVIVSRRTRGHKWQLVMTIQTIRLLADEIHITYVNTSRLLKTESVGLNLNLLSVNRSFICCEAIRRKNNFTNYI